MKPAATPATSGPRQRWLPRHILEKIVLLSEAVFLSCHDKGFTQLCQAKIYKFLVRTLFQRAGNDRRPKKACLYTGGLLLWRIRGLELQSDAVAFAQ